MYSVTLECRLSKLSNIFHFGHYFLVEYYSHISSFLFLVLLCSPNLDLIPNLPPPYQDMPRHILTGAPYMRVQIWINVDLQNPDQCGLSKSRLM